MKKVIASAVGLMMVGGVAVTSASAVENQFGGYWRTRIFVQDNMKSNPDGTYYRADNRTRLYYTAKFSDDFKFVNKFEFNSIWGDSNGGDIGADGDTWKVKNSYADFNLGTVNVKLGIQGATISRGFIFADDFSGAVVTANFGGVKVPLLYASVESEDAGGGTADEDLWAGMASIKVSDNMSVTPFVVYNTRSGVDTDVYFIGADMDMKMDSLKIWGTAIYNGGKVNDVDVNAFLVDVGVDAGIAHGEFIYASGDDGGDPDETNAFVSAPGQSFYWSEIMGLGIFDNTSSPGAPGDKISNIIAANAGVTLKPADKLTISGDVWYAMLAEDDAAGEDELGLEFDGKVAYSLMDNLKAELVLAYLVAGDATGDDDVFEGGVRVSLSF